jgi:tripartite-type tricarboxylate transporter receptor subunit TctC
LRPGGAVDSVARIVSERLRDKLQQSVVVENRPGAGALIGISFVAKAPPDGYTLLLMEPASVLAKWLHKTVSFDVTNDFAPIAMIATTPLVLFAHPSVAANDVKDLIAYSKANPGKLSVGTAGVGTPLHLAVLMLNAAAGIDIAHVSYRGATSALNDLLGGQIPLMWATPVAVMPFVAQGKVKALGVASKQRVQCCRRCRPSPKTPFPDLRSTFGWESQHPRGCPRMSSHGWGRLFGKSANFPLFRSV